MNFASHAVVACPESLPHACKAPLEMSDAKKLALLAEKLKRGQHLPEPRDAPYRDGSNAGVATEASFSVDLQSHQVIAKPKSVQDVVSCLCEARAIGSSVSVVGGNHSGYGRSGDLVLEMSHFNWVQAGQEPAPEQQTEKGDLPSLLHIGAGVTLKDVAVEAEHLGLAVALGTAPTVGLGLVLQGGVGHLTRKLGLSMDRIHSLQLVTAAEVLNLSSESEGTELKELFWAAVGCAPNFGVVTSVTLKAVPFQPCDSFRQVFEFKPRKDSKEDEVPLHSSLQKYLSWSSELPVDCSADCCLHFVRDLIGIQICLKMFALSALYQSSIIICSSVLQSCFKMLVAKENINIQAQSQPFCIFPWG